MSGDEEQKEENLYLRGSTWWFRAKIRGVRYRQSLHTSDVKVARKKRDELIEQIKATKGRGVKAVRFLAVAEQWAAWIADQVGARTAARYATSLKMLAPYLRGYDIGEIDTVVIADLMQARKADGASIATIKRDLTALSSVMKYAQLHGVAKDNPTLGPRKLVREKRQAIMLPEEGSIDIMLAVATREFGALMRGARLLGARQHELAKMRWRDLDLDRGTLEIIGKGGVRRTMQLSAEAIDFLRRHPRNLHTDLIFCDAAGKPFTGAAYKFKNLKRLVQRKCAKLGWAFVEYRFHDLRHLYAVERLRAGVSIYDIQQDMGHESVMTTEIYLKFLSADEQRAAKGGTNRATDAASRAKKG